MDWYKLDNAAKIFPFVQRSNVYASFRVSCLLKEDVDANLLQKALKETLIRFPNFCVKLKQGFFWYYLEHNDNEPIISLESSQVVNNISTKNNNGFLFKVTYFNKRISLNMFHGLTDGNGALEFLKSIVFNYLKLKGYDIKNDGSIISNDYELINSEFFDDYKENFNKKPKEKVKDEKAFKIKGTKYKNNFTGLYQIILDVDKTHDLANSFNTTMSGLLGGITLYSIYLTYFKNIEQKYNPRILIPVNARKYFDSISLRNFILFTHTIGEFRNKELELKDCISYMCESLNNINSDILYSQLYRNVKLEKNLFIRLIPLFLKTPIMKIGYKLIGSNITTLSFSNLGRVNVGDSMKEYIERFDFVLDPDNSFPIQIGVIGFNNNLVFSIATSLIKKTFIPNLIKTIDSLGLNIVVETNDVESL